MHYNRLVDQLYHRLIDHWHQYSYYRIQLDLHRLYNSTTLLVRMSGLLQVPLRLRLPVFRIELHIENISSKFYLFHYLKHL